MRSDVILLAVVAIFLEPGRAFLISNGSLRTLGAARRYVGSFQIASKARSNSRAPERPDKDRSLRRRTKSSQRRIRADKNSTNAIQTWRVFGVEVHPDAMTAADTQTKNYVTIESIYLSHVVLEALFSRVKMLPAWNRDESLLPEGVLDVRIVRRSLDARLHKRRSDGSLGPRFVYAIDMDVDTNALGTSNRRLVHQPGRMELLAPTSNESSTKDKLSTGSSDKVVLVVGAGPAGLFCALRLAKAGIKPIVLERGQPVESRGKDIGALMHRRSLDSESNFAFGEGGAGTWSDGKLTTRIGRNSDQVRYVLETLVSYGAPESILVDGAPHLGTENLVRLLRNMRSDLRRMGGELRFGTKVTGLVLDEGIARGVDCVVTSSAKERNIAVQMHSDDISGTIFADAVVLATGHSARDVYEKLHACGVRLEAKGFAVGFRVEHPQKIINAIQYGREWGPTVFTGKKVTDGANQEYFESFQHSDQLLSHTGKLPVPSYRLATDEVSDGDNYRGVYSFCMCPGGQIVPASTDANEVCVNGMSFSKRDSLWANSALVVTVTPDDPVLQPYREKNGVLAGLAFQRHMEQKAALMGGGNLTVPVQRLTDFIAGRPSTSCPSSSYRLGVRPAACHEIYPAPLVRALREALTEHFDQRMPGFVCEEGLLHAVETRTSSPVRISRDPTSLQALGIDNLFPAGEGAGFAGGIVSAAVDGIEVADAVIRGLNGITASAAQVQPTRIDSFY